MATLPRAAVAAGLCAVVLSAGCASAPPKPAAGIYQTPAGLGQYPFSDADIEFMSGMIPHHAQAVVMANWAKSHGAREVTDAGTFAERVGAWLTNANERKAVATAARATVAALGGGLERTLAALEPYLMQIRLERRASDA